MKIRELTLHDLKSLEGSAQFPLPNVNNPLYFYQIAVEDEKGLIGAAFVKLTTEVSLILGKDTGKVRRAKALLSVFEAIENAHEKNGLDDTHVFLLGENFGSFEIALKKLGFVSATGTPLYYQVGRNLWLKANNKKLARRRGISKSLQRRQQRETSSAEKVELSEKAD